MESLGTFDWGGVSIDLDALPNKVLKFFAQKGVVHKLSNEVSASVGKEKEKAGNGEFDEDAVTLDLRQKMVEKILAGDMRTTIGERGNVVEAIAYELAQARAESALKPKGLWPMPNRAKGIKAEEATVDFNGRIMNREDLTETVFQRYKDVLMAEAEKEKERRKEEAKANAANKVKPVEAVSSNIDDLI